MGEVSAALVKQLRERTGLGMMECKNALAEAGGDISRAEDLLRIRSGARASKAASRVAAEGIVGGCVAADSRSGAIVELNCETDFVSRNDDFLAFASLLARRVTEAAPADVNALLSLDDGGASLEQRRQALIQKIGENITVRRFVRMQGKQIAAYIHGGRIGVLVEFDGDAEAGRDVAMHVAFARPSCLRKEDVPPDVIGREREVLAARAKASGKPASIIDKMVEGGLAKFLSDFTLLGQPFVKDDKMTVAEMLMARKTLLHGFAFLVVGEGIDKKATDFVAEVMAQASQAR